LDAQNAGNGIPALQISKIFWWSTPPDPPFSCGMLATHVTFSHWYPFLIYYFTDRSLLKKCPPPPTGKSLKKVLDSYLFSTGCIKKRRPKYPYFYRKINYHIFVLRSI
jgi:hypothetical protein